MATLALDLGKRKIGAAINDEISLTAHPLRPLSGHSFDSLVKQLQGLFAERDITQLVVGLPLNMDGSEGPASRRARALARRLHSALGVPVHLHDERLSSFEAKERLKGRLKGSRLNEAVDSMAAAIILENWITSQSDGR